MRAMVMPRFGGPELFEERDVEQPEPGPGEVLVRVVVAGTNPVDAKLRADGSFAGLEPPVVLGSDVSGVVEEVGAGVADLAPGDEVYYTPEIFGPGSNGGYAEYNLVGAGIVAKKPASISHEEAAAVPLAGGTAYEVLVRRLGLRVGETVLIHGGAGGVGSFATRPFGRLATILGAQGDLTPLYVKNQTLHGVLLLRERARLDEMSLLLDRGQMRPLVDEVLDLGQVGEAHERLDSGHGRGKVVLRASEA